MDGLDFSIAGMDHAGEALAPADAYLSSWVGCSEVASLMVALDVRDGLPPRIQKWIADARTRAAWKKTKASPHAPTFDGEPLRATWAAVRATLVRTPVGMMPQCIAEKAGIRAKPASPYDAAAGNALEERLLRRWIETLRAAEAPLVDVDSIVTQAEMLARYPKAWRMRTPRIYHPTERRLVNYADAWCCDVVGEDIIINGKTSREYKVDLDPPAWIQMQGEIACAQASLGLVVIGQRWLADFGDIGRRPPEERGPIEVFPVEPDAKAEAAILYAVRESWQRVEVARQMSIEKQKGGA